MAKATPTRRAMLGAISLAPIAGLIVATPTRAASIDRSAWDRTFAEMERAKAAAEADDLRHKPIEDAFQAQEEQIPHTTLEADPYSGKLHRLSTANWQDVGDALADTRGRYSIDPQYPSVVAHYDLMERLVAAADARKAAVQRLGERMGYFASHERNEALTDSYNEAVFALMEMPAPDAQALAWKLNHAWGQETDEPDHGENGYCASLTMMWVGAIVRDARRLAGEA